MNLIKTSFYTSISTAITFISGFIVTKVVAVAIGPQGMAYVGQFQNTTSLFAMIGLAAINAGVIKYLAEYSDDSVKQQKVITTAFTVVITASLLTTFIVIAFSEQLSQAVFHSADFRIIFILYAVFLSAISLNTLSISILNGLKEDENFAPDHGCFSKGMSIAKKVRFVAIPTSQVYSNWECLTYQSVSDSFLLFYGQAFAD